MRSVEDSLQRLGTWRIDILLAHDLDVWTHRSEAARRARVEELMAGGYRAMLELRETGAVRAIGAGVNETAACQDLAERGDFDCFLLAGRYTLLEQLPLETLFPQCTKRGVGIVAGGPYNSGILAGGNTYNYAAAPAEILERARAIDAVCRAHDVALPAAALQFILANPLIVSVIPGGQTVAETRQNAAVLDERVPAALWRELKDKELLHPEAPTPQ
jgi:D-threo-aldose 1-dehydrogenase